jgi:hypothetical protein
LRGAPVGDSLKPMVFPAASCLPTRAGSRTVRFPDPQPRFRFAEPVFVPVHVHSPASKQDSFGLKTETLLEGGIAG